MMGIIRLSSIYIFALFILSNSVSALEKIGKTDYKITIIALVSVSLLLVILILAIIYYLYKFFSKSKQELKQEPKKSQKEENIEKVEVIEKTPSTNLSAEEHIFEDEIIKYLKGDEKIIARILKQREGSCEQATLRLISGFSKAKLSRLLVDMEERGVIKKEKKGKKNIVFLRA